MCPEYPTKDWQGKSCWPNPWERGPKVVERPGGVTATPNCLVHLGVESPGLPEIVVFRVLLQLGLHVTLVPRGNKANAVSAPFARVHCTQEKRITHE